MSTIIEKDAVITGSKSLGQQEKHEVQKQMNLTIKEAEALADGQSFELFDGRMVLKMADKMHSNCQAVFVGELYQYFKENPIGKVLPENSFRPWPENKHNLRTPDIAVFLNESFHQEEKYEPRAPDLAIEIVSDDDRASKVFAKARLYLEKGSRMVWLVFPTEESVLVMTSTEKRWESGKLECPDILPGFSIVVADLFAWKPPEASSVDE